MHGYYSILKIYILTVFFSQCCRFICRCILFLANVTSKTLSFFTSGFFSWVDITKVSVILSTTIQYSSTFYLCFNSEKTSAETETRLDFISYIWDDDHILILDEKSGNAYGIIQVSKESMLIILLLTYWGRRVCILKVIMFLRKNII